MSARMRNGLWWTACAIALAVHALGTDWCTASKVGSIFGYTLMCAGLWIGVDGIIKDAQKDE